MNVQAEAALGELHPELWVKFTIPKGPTELKANILPRPGRVPSQLPRALQQGKSVPFSNSIHMPESHRSFKGLYHTIAPPLQPFPPR